MPQATANVRLCAHRLPFVMYASHNPLFEGSPANAGRCDAEAAKHWITEPEMTSRREHPSLHTMMTRAVFGPLCVALSASLLALVWPASLVSSLGIALLWIAAAAWAFVQVQRCVWAVEHPIAQAAGTLRAMASGQNARIPAPTGVREMEPLTEAMADLREYLTVMVVEDDDGEVTGEASPQRPFTAPVTTRGDRLVTRARRSVAIHAPRQNLSRAA